MNNMTSGSDIERANVFTISDTKITGTIVLDNPTGNEAAFTINYTTNKATSGNDTGLLINMTDTASPGTSLLQDWQVGGVSKVRISSVGELFVANTVTAYNLTLTTDQWYSSAVNKTMHIGGVNGYAVSDIGISMLECTFSGAGVSQIGVQINHTINQSTTSSMTDLNILRTETALGSGEQLFLSMGTVALGVLTKFRNDGVWFPRQAITASAPTYVEGGVYYDTTLHKLRIGGAAGWETITSV
jgi:hypothetical protein